MSPGSLFENHHVRVGTIAGVIVACCLGAFQAGTMKERITTDIDNLKQYAASELEWREEMIKLSREIGDLTRDNTRRIDKLERN